MHDCSQIKGQTFCTREFKSWKSGKASQHLSQLLKLLATISQQNTSGKLELIKQTNAAGEFFIFYFQNYF